VADESRPTLCEDGSCGTTDAHAASWQSSSCGVADHTLSVASEMSAAAEIERARARNHFRIGRTRLTPGAECVKDRAAQTPRRRRRRADAAAAARCSLVHGTLLASIVV